MAVIRADVLIAGLAGPVPRTARGASVMVLAKAPAWAKKPFVLKNAPHTIVAPHDGQKEIWADFGAIAKAHKGTTGKIEGLPPIAYFIRKELKGAEEPDKIKDPKDYPSRKRVRYEQITAELSRKGKTTWLAMHRGVPPVR